MKILVVGSQRQTRRLYRLLRNLTGGATSFCPGPDALEGLIRTGRDFDYIIFEQVGIGPRSEKRKIRGPFHLGPAAGGRRVSRDQRPRLVGVFETTPAARRLLNCVLAVPSPEPLPDEEGGFEGQIAFEFSRPYRRKSSGF